MKGGGDEKLATGGWRPYGNVDYPAALTMVPAPWLRLPASGCMARAAGFGGQGGRCEAPDPCTLTPDPAP